ncbi:MAG: hypothetical protein H7039_01265 [Bryobacteraceae bacterium]|nr:hypothetical protein [Bryobacteraceae bacterium]
MKNFSYRQVVFLLLAVFASGAVAGGFVVSLYKTKTVTANSAPRAWREQYVGNLTSRLKLSGEQVLQLNTILDETKSRYDAVKRQYKPDMDRIHGEQVDKVRAMLNSSQVPEYDRFRVEREKAKAQAAAAGGGQK